MLTGDRKLLVCVLLLVVSSAALAQQRTFALKESAILFGRFGHGLTVTTPQGSRVIDVPTAASRRRPVATPSISRDGTLVAWGFPAADDPGKKWKVRCSVGIYSIRQQRWRIYGNFSDVNATAISPDGSLVAFIAEETDASSRSLHVLDVKNGGISKLKSIAAGSLSWAPDGKRLSITVPYAVASKVLVYEIDAQSVKELAEGAFPSWSPDGKWVAYVDNSRVKIHLVQPDGTGDHVVTDVSAHVLGYRYFGLQPIWSPDGKKLLLNEYKGDGDSQDVVLLDLSSGKVTRISKNGYPVLGWAAYHK